MAATNEKHGINKISEEIIRKTAVKATLGTPGVSRLSDSFTDNLTKMLYGKEPSGAGVKIGNNDGAVTIDIFVIVEFGVKIPQVAWEIQNAVKNSVREMTKITPEAVNIHVQGVSRQSVQYGKDKAR